MFRHFTYAREADIMMDVLGSHLVSRILCSIYHFHVYLHFFYAFACGASSVNVKRIRHVREFASGGSCHLFSQPIFVTTPWIAGETLLKSKPSLYRLIWMSLSAGYVWIILWRDVRLRHLRNTPRLQREGMSRLTYFYTVAVLRHGSQARRATVQFVWRMQCFHSAASPSGNK